MKNIREVNINSKKILLRADFNVAIENGAVKEGFKIAACKETVDHLLSQNCKVALCSHLGRPNGKPNPEFSLGQIKDDITNILGINIVFIDDCIGEKVKNGLENLKSGEILLLENVRFYPGEETNDENFAKQLAENFQIFVNDAFSVCHRDQASVTGVAKILPSYAGMRLEKEIEEMEKVYPHTNLDGNSVNEQSGGNKTNYKNRLNGDEKVGVEVKNNFARPAVAIIGGAKIETKLPVIQAFEKIYDYVLVGGKIANEAIDQEIQFSDKVNLPVDFIDDRLDIGPETINKFSEIIKTAKTIVWNGPMGKFEEEKYAQGTQKIFEAVIAGSAYTLVGGGETLEILEKNQAMNKISFVSTGGGAMLEYLSGNKMPGIEILDATHSTENGSQTIIAKTSST